MEQLKFIFTVPADLDRAYILIGSNAATALSLDLYIDDFSIGRTD